MASSIKSSNIEFTLDKFHHYLISKYDIGRVPSVAKMVTLDSMWLKVQFTQESKYFNITKRI